MAPLGHSFWTHSPPWGPGFGLGRCISPQDQEGVGGTSFLEGSWAGVGGWCLLGHMSWHPDITRPDLGSQVPTDTKSPVGAGGRPIPALGPVHGPQNTKQSRPPPAAVKSQSRSSGWQPQPGVLEVGDIYVPTSPSWAQHSSWPVGGGQGSLLKGVSLGSCEAWGWWEGP